MKKDIPVFYDKSGYLHLIEFAGAVGIIVCGAAGYDALREKVEETEPTPPVKRKETCV